jgi:GMP synthase (glutamine-hydrolysing)
MHGIEVLALIHQADAPPGTFGDVVEEHGHVLDIRTYAGDNPPPPDAVERYGAVLVFGGSAQVDEPHAWLGPERLLIGDLIVAGTPLLGVCLGSQLLAQVAGGEVGPARRREIGWHEVELTVGGERDPLLGVLSPRFAAFQWHSYGFRLPPSGAALAHSSDDALQAVRVGESAWGIQFHAEVNSAIVDAWIDEDAGHELDDAAALRGQTQANLPRWSGQGRALCARFLEIASRR